MYVYIYTHTYRLPRKHWRYQLCRGIAIPQSCLHGHHLLVKSKTTSEGVLIQSHIEEALLPCLSCFSFFQPLDMLILSKIWGMMKYLNCCNNDYHVSLHAARYVLTVYSTWHDAEGNPWELLPWVWFRSTSVITAHAQFLCFPSVHKHAKFEAHVLIQR